MITILHLYPRELGINGDVGNVTALRKRAQWRGVQARVLDHEVGSDLPADAPHVIHIGSGPVASQELVLADLARIAPTLREWSRAGVPFLAISGGWQVLGRRLTFLNGTSVEGAGVFPSEATLVATRTVREVWRDDVAGFENHAAVTTVDGAPADWPVVRWGHSIATTLHGPFLPMNPRFADELLERAAERAGVTLGRADDRLAEVDDRAARSRQAVRSRL